MQGHFRERDQLEDHPGLLSSQSLLVLLQQEANTTSISMSLAGHVAHDTLDLLLSSRCGTLGMPKSTSPAMNQIRVQWRRMISCKLLCSASYLPFSLGLILTKIFLSLKRLNTVSIVHIHHLNHINITCSDRPQEHEEIWLACHSIGCCWETCFAE